MTPMRIVAAIAILGTLTIGLHRYMWARLVRDTQLPAPWGTVATWALVVLAVVMVAALVLPRLASRDAASPVAWVGYTWMGVAFLLVIALAAVDLANLMTRIARAMMDSGAIDPDRRELLARLAGGAVTIGVLGMGAAALFEGVRRVAIKHVRVPLVKLPAGADGYRIAQLSDVHVGPTLGKEFIEGLVASTNALNADMIVITGDLVDGSVEELGQHVAPLAKLRARDGVFFVTGNHEYYSGADEWIRFVETLGIRVLRNERVPIGDHFDLAGVDDSTAHQFGNGHGEDIPRALAGRDPSRALVLLAHQPRAIAKASEHGVDLQLSGHTHGGQMFPFGFLVKLVQPYVSGLHRHGASTIYVSNGTGFWGPPMRLGAPAEITHLTLVTSAT